MAKVSYNAVGRRKKAVARVRLVAGEGKIVINKRDIDNYFGLETLKMTVRQPLVLTNTTSFDILVNVCGGGVTVEASALYAYKERSLRHLSCILSQRGYFNIPYVCLRIIFKKLTKFHEYPPFDISLRSRRR